MDPRRGDETTGSGPSRRDVLVELVTTLWWVPPALVVCAVLLVKTLT